MSPEPTHAAVHGELIEDGTVLRILLDRPKGNVLTCAMMRQLTDLLRAHREDRSLRLVILRGAGSHFSFGASVEEHQRDQAPEMLATFRKLMQAVAGFPVPVAACVQGRCLGGAFEVVLACHLIFATGSAVFACPEIKLGVFPPAFAVLAPRRLGEPLAERLIVTGEDLDAGAADRAGLLAAIIPNDDPEAAVLDWYRERLRPLSAFAIRQATRAIRAGSGLLQALQGPIAAAEAQYLESVLPSHDGNEGIEAFIERRPPVWEDA